MREQKVVKGRPREEPGGLEAQRRLRRGAGPKSNPPQPPRALFFRERDIFHPWLKRKLRTQQSGHGAIW